MTPRAHTLLTFLFLWLLTSPGRAQLPAAHRVGAPILEDFVYTLQSGAQVYSQKLHQTIQVTSDAPDLVLTGKNATYRYHQQAPEYMLTLTDVYRVPEETKLRGSFVALTQNVELFTNQVRALGAWKDSLTEPLTLGGPNRRLLWISALIGGAIGAAALGMAIWCTVQIYQLRDRVSTLESRMDDTNTKLNALTSDLKDFTNKTEQWEALQEDINARLNGQVNVLFNQTAEQMILINKGAAITQNITNYLALRAQTDNERFANITKNFVIMQSDIDVRFAGQTEQFKAAMAELYAQMLSMNDGVTSILANLQLELQKIRRTVYELTGSVYDLYTDAQMRRMTATSIAQEIASLDPAVELPLISADYAIPTVDAKNHRTMIETFRVNFVKLDAITGKRVATSYNITFFYNMEFAITHARPYDSAENFMANLLQIPCVRSEKSTGNGVVFREPDNSTQDLCDMWIEYRRRECILKDTTGPGVNWVEWTFQNPTDGSKRGDMPSECQSEVLVVPSLADFDNFTSSLQEWRTFMHDDICTASLAPDAPHFQLTMYQMNRIATIRQNVTVCGLPYDQQVVMGAQSVESMIYRTLDLIPRYVATQLAIDTENAYGRAPMLGLKRINDRIQDMFQAPGQPASPSTAAGTRVAFHLFNSVSKAMATVRHYEVAYPLAWSAPMTVTLMNQTAGDYNVTEQMLDYQQWRLTIDSDVLSGLPFSGLIVGDLFPESTTTYDAPREWLTWTGDSRGNGKVAQLAFPKDTFTTPGLDELLKFNPYYDPLNVASLSAVKVDLGRVESGPHAGAPYCRVKGGVPINVTDNILDPGMREIPNGDWCSIMRSFDVRMVLAPGGQMMLGVTPKQWSMLVDVELPTGFLATNLGKEGCAPFELKLVSGTRGALVFTNQDEFHDYPMRVLTSNGSLPQLCNKAQVFSVPRVGSAEIVLPPCNHLSVIIQKLLDPATGLYGTCTQFSGDDYAKLIETTITVPETIRYSTEIAVNQALTGLADSTWSNIQAGILLAQILADITSASASVRTNINALSNATAALRYAGGNWTTLLPVVDGLESTLNALVQDSNAYKQATDDQLARVQSAMAGWAEYQVFFGTASAAQSAIRELQRNITTKLGTYGFKVGDWGSNSGDFMDFLNGVGDVFVAIGGAIGDVYDDVTKPFSNLFDSIGGIGGFVSILMWVGVLIFLFVFVVPRLNKKPADQAGGSGVTVVNATRPGTSGRRRGGEYRQMRRMQAYRDEDGMEEDRE